MRLLKRVLDGSCIVSNLSEILDISAVYVVYTKNEAEDYLILDIGESGNIREKISRHDRKSCWERNKIMGIYYWIIPCDGRVRRVLAHVMRDLYRPLCGIR